MSGSRIEQHRQAYAYCAYCPKICRFACPVSDAVPSETVSTWGKMTEAHLVTTQKRSLEPGGAKALYACTGCMRCRTYCRHENEVGFALFTARQEAIDRELAPQGARSTVRTFSQFGNPFGVDLSPLVARYRADTPVRFQLFPGCTTLAKRGEVLEAALAVGEALGAPFGVAKSSNRCCGYPLYAAGDLREFERHARATAEALKPYPELVVLDPGCAYTLRVVYPRVGVALQTDVRTIYEVLAERVDHAPSRPPMEETVAYHDACHLGRGLGQYEEPRRLLRAAVKHVREAQEHHGEAGCSGGGGLLPRTMAEASVTIARRQAERAAPDGETVVTACPTSRRMFERAGRRSEDLLTLVRRWINAKDERRR
ncbi:MAG: (Fe-S)-binding protein [Myxococcaceae bacterium]|nr:(Fe-S)-binding protein [Myxococcaceae bacterium]